MTYMLVRPGLRNVLGEKESTEYERGFLQTMRSHAGKKPAADAPKDSTGTQVDTILSAMLLAAEDAPNGKLSAETEQAFNRLWASQAADGAWSWYNLELDPWEMPDRDSMARRLQLWPWAAHRRNIGSVRKCVSTSAG